MLNCIKAGKYTIDLNNKTVVMGIMNITPDSFSDGGKYSSRDVVLKRANQMVKDGASIIDIGGESTRPGATKVSQEEELERVIPIVEVISREIDIPISIDTYKSSVAREALKNGAHIINDVWGAKLDINIGDVAREFNAPIILMHNRNEAIYNSYLEDVVSDLKESIQIVKSRGVRDEQIILDPGVGFAKNLNNNLSIIKNIEVVVSIGYPVLIGTSRKSMIGKVIESDVEDRIEGTIASSLYAVVKGCKLVRVHDVKEVKRAVKMLDAIMYS